MISAISTDSSEVVSHQRADEHTADDTPQPRKDHQRNDGQQNLDDGVLLFMISTPFYSSYQIFQELQAWRRFHSEGLTFSDCFTLSIAKRRPATRFLGASVIDFFRFFRTLPALMPSLYFAKFAFSEMLPLAKILSRTPSPTAKSHIRMIIHTYTDYQRFVI